MTAAQNGLEHMAALSSQMVTAAQANDWDTLVQLEEQMTAVRTQLENTPPAVPSDADTLARHAALLHQMQEDQAKVMEHVRPWMDSARNLLAGHAKGRAVHKAYTTPGF